MHLFVHRLNTRFIQFTLFIWWFFFQMKFLCIIMVILLLVAIAMVSLNKTGLNEQPLNRLAIAFFSWSVWVFSQSEFSVDGLDGSLSVSVLIISLCELHWLHVPFTYRHAKTTHDPKRTTIYTCISILFKSFSYIYMYVCM